MIVDINAPAVLVAIVALGAYFASGTLAAFYFATRRRIVKRLREDDPKVLEALLTYPSVVSRIGTAQILALAFVGGTGMIALLFVLCPYARQGKGIMGVCSESDPISRACGNGFPNGRAGASPEGAHLRRQ